MFICEVFLLGLFVGAFGMGMYDAWFDEKELKKEIKKDMERNARE